MSIENFYTLHAFTGPSSAANQAAHGSKGMAKGGISFMDLVEAKLKEEQGQEDDLDLVALLAANPEIEEQVNQFIESTGISDAEALAQTLQLNQTAFDNILKPLTDGIITVDEQNMGGTELSLEQFLIDKAKELEDIKLADFAKARHKFKALLEINSDLAVAANLTVEEMTAIETGEIADPEMLSSILDKISTALIEIVKAEGGLEDLPHDDPALLNTIAILSARNNVKGVSNDNALKVKLNTLTVGGESGAASGTNYQSIFDAIKQQLGFGANNGDGKTDLPAGKAMTDSSAGTPTPNLGFLQHGVFDLSNPLLAGMEFLNGVADQYAVNLSTGTALSSGIMTSAITQAQAATHSHPAAQMVAATIQKSAANGEARDFTIRLDPPELGKLNAKLSFGKDKTMKAIITVEKPETYLMLQRDSAALERSLSEAGLDLGDGGLSFELAEQGFDFDGNPRGGGHDQGGTGAGGSGDEAEEIIETTMTWHVDPETGMTRYDIWA